MSLIDIQIYSAFGKLFGKETGTGDKVSVLINLKITANAKIKITKTTIIETM